MRSAIQSFTEAGTPCSISITALSRSMSASISAHRPVSDPGCPRVATFRQNRCALCVGRTPRFRGQAVVERQPGRRGPRRCAGQVGCDPAAIYDGVRLAAHRIVEEEERLITASARAWRNRCPRFPVGVFSLPRIVGSAQVLSLWRQTYRKTAIWLGRTA